jgi:SepF-like predicted cell division protein (DUF552 family)
MTTKSKIKKRLQPQNMVYSAEQEGIIKVIQVSTYECVISNNHQLSQGNLT